MDGVLDDVPGLGIERIFEVRSERMGYWIERVRRHHLPSLGWGPVNTGQAFVLGLEESDRGVSAEHHMKGLWGIGSS